MFLSFGLDEKDRLVSIVEAPQGKSNLRCPYCLAPLIAKKGSVNEHHFAHVDDTCVESKTNIKLAAIPFYDVGCGLTKSEMAVVNKVAKYNNCKPSWISKTLTPTLEALISVGIIKRTTPVNLSLTKLGREIYSLDNGFATPLSVLPETKMQERLFAIRLRLLEFLDSNTGTKAALAYSLRLNTLFGQHLYVLSTTLQIADTSFPLIKVGLTARDIDERMSEVRRDLSKHGEVVSLELHGLYPHYGSIERLVHTKLSSARFELGNHQEYFSSIEVAPLLKHVGLSHLGKRVIEGSKVRVVYREHSNKVRRGQSVQKMLNNTHLGRKPLSDEELIDNHSDIVECYGNSLSLRATSKKTQKAINTVRKVYTLLKRMESLNHSTTLS